MRGFAPFGCGPGQKLSRVEYKAAVQELVDMVPKALQTTFRPAPPFAQNHQIALQVLQPTWDRCQELKEALAAAAEARNFRIKGQQPRFQVEMSPKRKHLCQNLFRAVDALKHLGFQEEKYEICGRGLKPYALPGYEPLGATPPTTSQWEWNAAGLAKLGLDKAKVDAACAEVQA